jgi:hypothetical protein
MMNPSTLHTYLDVLMQHIIELMGEADQWPEGAQEPLRHCWTHVDAMTVMLSQTEPPTPEELDERIASLWAEFEMFERFEFRQKVVWHLHVLRDTLIYVSQDMQDYHARHLILSSVSSHSYQGLNSPTPF